VHVTEEIRARTHRVYLFLMAFWSSQRPSSISPGAGRSESSKTAASPRRLDLEPEHQRLHSRVVVGQAAIREMAERYEETHRRRDLPRQLDRRTKLRS